MQTTKRQQALASAKLRSRPVTWKCEFHIQSSSLIFFSQDVVFKFVWSHINTTIKHQDVSITLGWHSHTSWVSVTSLSPQIAKTIQYSQSLYGSLSNISLRTANNSQGLNIIFLSTIKQMVSAEVSKQRRDTEA